VAKVTVTLRLVNHTFPDDIDVLLVNPRGVGVILMSGAGGAFNLANRTLTFDDDAPISLPDNAQIASQTYKPTNYPPGDLFPDAPSGPYETQLSALIGSSPNGPWRLYIVDHGDGDTGSVDGGWELTFTFGTAPIADDDSAMTPNSTPVTIDVLANDTTEPFEKEPSTVTVTSGPSHGGTSVNAASGQITYTPTAGYSGPDSFTYTFKDSASLTSNPATVRVTVDPPIIVTTPTETATVTMTPTGTGTVVTTPAGTGTVGTTPATATVVTTSVPTAITTPTLSPTLISVTPTATATPPPVVVSVRQAGTNRLQVELTVSGTLQRIEWAAPPNASIEDEAGTPIAGGTLVLPANTSRATLYMRRLSGTSATVPLTLVGSFGIWHTFVGGGPDAW